MPAGVWAETRGAAARANRVRASAGRTEEMMEALLKGPLRCLV